MIKPVYTENNALVNGANHSAIHPNKTTTEELTYGVRQGIEGP